MIRYIQVFFLTLLISACSVLPDASLSEKAQPQSPTSRHPAVIALLDTADTQRNTGQTGRSAATLERAVKIEPRNARLWQRLGRIRLDLGQWSQAENLASKSNALAAGDRHVKAENWRIIGQARLKQGRRQAANQAFAQANSLENH